MPVNSTSEPRSVVGLLLAAGAGKRFGGTKLVDAKLNGQAIGLLAAETFKKILPLYVVVRAGDEVTRRMFETAGFQVIVSQRAASGMGYSLAAGIEFIKGLSVDACLIGLADMPLIKAQTLAMLCEHLQQGAEIVRPRYLGRPGQPVGFQRRHFDSLCGFSVDKGAREYLRSHQALVDYVEVEDEGTVIDVDTEEALSKLMTATASA